MQGVQNLKPDTILKTTFLTSFSLRMLVKVR